MKVIKVSLCCTELIQRRGNFIKIPSGLGDCNDKKNTVVLSFVSKRDFSVPAHQEGPGRRTEGYIGNCA